MGRTAFANGIPAAAPHLHLCLVVPNVGLGNLFVAMLAQCWCKLCADDLKRSIGKHLISTSGTGEGR